MKKAKCFSVLISLAFLLLIGGVMTGLSSAKDVSPVLTLKYHHGYSTTNWRHFIAEDFKELTEKKTEGRVKVDIYPAGQLFKGPAELEAIARGSIHVSPVVYSYLSTYNPEFLATDMPFLFNEKAAYAFDDSDILKEMSAKLELKGIKVLGLWALTPCCLYTRNKPITKMEDMKGIRIRVWAGRIQEDEMKIVGAAPVTIAAAEVAEALQRGLIEAVFTDPATALVSNYYEQLKYGMLGYDRYYLSPLVANLQIWNQMPGTIREILEKGVVPEAKRRHLERMKVYSDDAIKKLKELGIIYTELKGPNFEAWRSTITEKHWPLYEDKIGKRVLSAIKELSGIR